MLRPGTDVYSSPWLRHCLQDIIISLLQVMLTAKYPEVEASYKNCHTLQNKNRICTCSEILNTVPYFSKHSIKSDAALPVAVANASKPQLLQSLSLMLIFTELTWNLSIRSKATWAKSFLMLLAYCKQIIKNQRKTVRRAVTINACWQKSSCELFPSATTRACTQHWSWSRDWNRGAAACLLMVNAICYACVWRNNRLCD